MADPSKKDTKRIFINHVDSFQGKNLAQFLSQCVVGASLEDIDDEEEETGSVASGPISKPKDGCYQIVGTVKNSNFTKPDFIKDIIKYDTKEQLYEQMIECDVIVYDITEEPEQIDEAVWAVSEIHADLDKLERQKMFVLISTLMTWAKSKPVDPDDPEIPFTEDDYRRRKPHPNFKEHIAAEKTVMKMGKTSKSKLVTYVVAPGLTYGMEENIFHFLFKAAWHNAPDLQCFGNGSNTVPSIHVRDLAAVIQNIADSRPKVRYIVAVDDSKNTLEEIVKAVSQNLGSGKIKFISKEDALLQKDIAQADFDTLLINIRMDGVFIKENMRIRWAAETGLVENIQNVVKEYKESRKLTPLRAMIIGPPAVGKSSVAKQLCDHYKIHHIHIKDVIDHAMENLQQLAARAEKEGEEEEGEEEVGMSADEAQGLLEEIATNKEENNGRLDDQFLVRFCKEKIMSKPCQNQGFILDGFPKTEAQAKELFQAVADDEEEEEGKTPYDKNIMPEFIFLLEADDKFLRDRIMNLPENIVAGTHNTEEGLTRRLASYRDMNSEEDSIVNYFDEIENHPTKIDVMKDKSEMMKDTCDLIRKLMGEPRNYGPTPEELEEIRRKAEDERLKKEQEQREEKEKKEAEEAQARRQKQEEWVQRLEDVKKEEYELLETQSVPLRNYLMRHVMPTLTQGLIDCCKIRPDDPIDFLAEYLFQNNPQVDS